MSSLYFPLSPLTSTIENKWNNKLKNIPRKTPIILWNWSWKQKVYFSYPKLEDNFSALGFSHSLGLGINSFFETLKKYRRAHVIMYQTPVHSQPRF